MTEHAAVRLLALPATALLATCGGASAPDAEPADLAIVDGINVALGTDSGTANVPMGWGTHHELELYVEAGLTPMETLVAATATGAGRMPPVGEADFGTLTAGMSADLVVLNADPLADIRNTLQIDRVMLRGEWVERDALLPSP